MSGSLPLPKHQELSTFKGLLERRLPEKILYISSAFEDMEECLEN